MNEIGIVYIAYSRKDKIEKTFEALLNCIGINECDIHVFSDAAASEKDEESVRSAREYIRKKTAENKEINIQIHEHESNKGSFENISGGLQCVADRYDYVLLVEEDVLVNSHFIQYSRKVLDLYDDMNIIGVSAYNPVQNLNISSDLFYSDRFCCYGLAMRSRDIKKLCWDINKLDLKKIDKKKFYKSAKDISACFEDDLKGKRYFQTSWDVIIFYNMLLNKQREVLPRISLCTNIGFDGSGEWSTTGSFRNDNYQEDYGSDMDLQSISNLDAHNQQSFYDGFIQDTLKKKVLRTGRRIASLFHIEGFARRMKRIFK